jgi:hypothetical protein
MLDIRTAVFGNDVLRVKSGLGRGPQSQHRQKVQILPARPMDENRALLC